MHERLEQLQESSVPESDSATSVDLDPVLSVVQLVDNDTSEVPTPWTRAVLVLQEHHVPDVQVAERSCVLVITVYDTSVQPGRALFSQDP